MKKFALITLACIVGGCDRSTVGTEAPTNSAGGGGKAKSEMLVLSGDLQGYSDQLCRTPLDRKAYAEFASKIFAWPAEPARDEMMKKVENGDIEVIWGAVTRNLMRRSAELQDVIASQVDDINADFHWVLLRNFELKRVEAQVAKQMQRATPDPEGAKFREAGWQLVSDAATVLTVHQSERKRTLDSPEEMKSFVGIHDVLGVDPRVHTVLKSLADGQLNIVWKTFYWTGDSKAPEARSILVSYRDPKLPQLVFVATRGKTQAILTRKEFEESPTQLVESE